MAPNLIYQYYFPFTGPNKDLIEPGERGLPLWAEIGVRSGKNYADRIDVHHEFNYKTRIGAPNQNLEACRIFMDPFFDDYDKVLMLDIDTIIPTEHNIFDNEIIDMGMVQDGGPGSPQKWIKETVNKLEDYGGVTFPTSKTYFEKRYLNGGVVLWSKKGRIKAREKFGGLREMFRYRETLQMNEQPYLNLMINKHNMHVTELPPEWNSMNYMWRGGEPKGKIWHFLGTSKRTMKKYHGV